MAIARAIAKRPDVLLCDEPTGALDFATGRVVLEVIERINRELGTATALITHNASIAEHGRSRDQLPRRAHRRDATVNAHAQAARASSPGDRMRALDRALVP